MFKILGVVFLVLFGLVIGFFTWLFFKAKSGMVTHERVAAIDAALKMPPIILEPTDTPVLAQPELVAALTAQAEELGATSCGTYNVPSAGIRLIAYALATPPVYIAIYDHDELEPWVDVVLRFGRDKSLTVSSVSEIGRGAPRHPDQEFTPFAPGTKIGALVQAAAERANCDSVLAAEPENFQSYFEAAAEKSRSYIETQDVSQDWLKTIAKDAGVELSGGEAEQINQIRREQQATRTVSACIQSLAESGKFTAAQWNEIHESLVVVWDDMPGDHAAAVFYLHGDIPPELEDEIDALEECHGDARRRIKMLNDKLPAESRLIPVADVSSPTHADIYRGNVPIV